MPPRGYLAVIRTIDRFTEWTGYLFVLFLIPLIMSNVIEVFARYVLKDPTIWALDITTMSYAALFMLGSALALLKGDRRFDDIRQRILGHIRKERAELGPISLT